LITVVHADVQENAFANIQRLIMETFKMNKNIKNLLTELYNANKETEEAAGNCAGSSRATEREDSNNFYRAKSRRERAVEALIKFAAEMQKE
jgi:hypothetical protein